MAKNLTALPFTEMVERVAEMARIADDGLSRVRAAVQDEYRDLRNKEDWTFLFSTSAIAAIAPYTVGVASVNTQDTAVTFSTDAVITAAMTGRKVKFNSNGNVYEFTFSNTTGGTISPPLSGDSNVVSGAFSIFQDTYALPDDFARFPRNVAVIKQDGGRNTAIPEFKSYGDWVTNYNPSPSTPEKCRVVEVGTGGNSSVQFNPPPNKAYVFPFAYVRDMPPLRETTAGVAVIDAGSVAVVGSVGVSRFTEVSTGSYFRISAFGKRDDSEWYRVISIANNSAMTLQTAFGTSSASSAGYTLCTAPAMPEIMHPAIVYGALMRILVDQNDTMYQWASSMKSVILTDARRLYKSRDYSADIDGVWEDYHYRR